MLGGAPVAALFTRECPDSALAKNMARKGALLRSGMDESDLIEHLLTPRKAKLLFLCCQEIDREDHSGGIVGSSLALRRICCRAAGSEVM